MGCSMDRLWDVEAYSVVRGAAERGHVLAVDDEARRICARIDDAPEPDEVAKRLVDLAVALKAALHFDGSAERPPIRLPEAGRFE